MVEIMELFVNVNRSGRVTSRANYPDSAATVKIAQDPSATLLSLDAYLVMLTSAGARLISFDDYLAGKINSPVLALLCEHRSSDPLSVLSVVFQARVMGLSDPFAHGQSSTDQICTLSMASYMRPGQSGPYHMISDTISAWNVKYIPKSSVMSEITFRPSYDVMQLDLVGTTRLASKYSFDGNQLEWVLLKPDMLSVVKRFYMQISPTSDGVPVSLDTVTVQADGASLSPCTIVQVGDSVDYLFTLWDLSGLAVVTQDPLEFTIVWLGLRVALEGGDLKPVFIKQNDVASASPTLSDASTLRCYGYKELAVTPPEENP